MDRGHSRLTQASIALTEGTDGRRAEIQRLLARWALLREQLDQVDARLAPLVDEMPAAKALLSVPGVSVVCVTPLVAESGDPDCYESPRQVLKLAGMNLAGRESGFSLRGHIRQTKRGRQLLRRQPFLLARRWCKKKGLYRAHYEALRAQGKSKTSCVCAIARKLVPMLLHIMHTHEPFDRATWERNRLTTDQAA